VVPTGVPKKRPMESGLDLAADFGDFEGASVRFFSHKSGLVSHYFPISMGNGTA